MATGKEAPGVAVVAEADRDQGAVVARALSATGMIVVLCGTDSGALGSLGAEIEADGGRVAIFAGDVRDGAAREVLVEMVSELFGPRAEPDRR